MSAPGAQSHLTGTRSIAVTSACPICERPGCASEIREQSSFGTLDLPPRDEIRDLWSASGLNQASETNL
jgi:hypothetical protein